jgi:hypothetical protein
MGKVGLLARVWRWRPRSALAVVAQALGSVAVVMAVSIGLGDIAYGAMFSATWVGIRVPLDLIRLRRQRRSGVATLDARGGAMHPIPNDDLDRWLRG